MISRCKLSPLSFTQCAAVEKRRTPNRFHKERLLFLHERLQRRLPTRAERTWNASRILEAQAIDRAKGGDRRGVPDWLSMFLKKRLPLSLQPV